MSQTDFHDIKELTKQPSALARERLLLGHHKDKAPWNLLSRLDVETVDLLATGAVRAATVATERPAFGDVLRMRAQGGNAGKGSLAESSTTTLHPRCPPDDDPRFKPAKAGDTFGPAWSTHWLTVDCNIPASWAGKEVHLIVDTSGEAMVWRGGRPYHGLLGGDGDDRRDRVVLHQSYDAASAHPERIEIEIAGTFMFGVGAGNQWGGLGPSIPDRSRTFELKVLRLAVFDREAWTLTMDLEIAAGLANELPEGSVRAEDALSAASAALDALDFGDPSTRAAARAPLDRFFAARNGDAQHTVHAVGMSHIDTAWLWPISETVRKCARSFATQMRLMEQDPALTFAFSQAQQLEYIRAEYPALMDEIRARAAEGRFAVVGGTWVEMDCNIPGPESLARQFLLGQRYFREQLAGHTCEEFWLPDTFGYCAQLPQLCQQAGIRFFLTQKLSWNQFNKFPHHTFLWEGLDGSRVLTHFPPADTYGASVTPKEVMHHIKQFRDKRSARESVMLFGWGDGGGGPTPAMLHRIARLADVDGAPKVAHSTPSRFWRAAEASARAEGAPVWRDELMLEKHRGVLTTCGAVKRDNRRAEELLRHLELAEAASGLDLGAEADWPAVLTAQFHDIIPGTSIREVYDDCEVLYRALLGSDPRTNATMEARIRAAARDAAAAANGEEAEGAPLVWNALEWERCEVVTRGDGSLARVRAPAMGLATTGPDTAASASFADDNPSPAKLITELDGGGFELCNGILRARIDAGGRIVSLVLLADEHCGSAAGRADFEFVPGGSPMAVLAMFRDEQRYWSAWDVDLEHLDARVEVPAAAASVTAAAATAGQHQQDQAQLRAAVEVSVKLSPTSTLTCVISLDAGSRQLRLAYEVDWHETHKMLKVEFPSRVRSDHATFEIQYGHVRRPAHFNTSFDTAKFEVCAQRWCDLGGHGHGLSVLNNCKYGHSVHGDTISVSLLRSSKEPNETMDVGKHYFTLALFPHAGRFQDAGTIREAAALNCPLRLVEPEGAAPASAARASAAGAKSSWSFLSVSTAAVAVSAVKPAYAGPTPARFAESPAEESGTGKKRARRSGAPGSGGGPRRVIVRIHEQFGSHTGQAVRLAGLLAARATTVCATNILEDELSPESELARDDIRIKDGEIVLERGLAAFEIVTLMLDLA